MTKLGFDVTQHLKALPGTPSLVLRLRRLKSLFPVIHMAQIISQPSQQQDVHVQLPE